MSDSRLLGGLVIPLLRLLHQSHSDSLGRDPDFADPAVNNGPHLLDIGLEFSPANASDFAADTA
jgi:hypothetical protein